MAFHFAERQLESALMPLPAAIIEKLALNGDVSGLKPTEKVAYYRALCERVGLDPATQPFKLLRMNGREVFYCDRGGAAQLNRLHSVSHTIVSREVTNDCYVVTVRASTSTRHLDSIGAVPIAGLKGEALCNAYMKSETKAKRRATLDLLGLGMLDETEVGTIPGAEPVPLPVSLSKPAELAPAASDHINTPPTPEKSPISQPEQPKPLLRPNNDSKWKMIGELKAGEGEVNRELVTRFFQAAGTLDQSKTIEQLPLNFVPGSAKQMRDLGEAIAKFDAGERAVMPFKHDILGHLAAEVGANRASAPASTAKQAATWRQHVVLWGSLKGNTLGQLPDDVLMDLYTTFTPNDEGPEQFREQNQQLRDALDAAGVEKGWKRE